jgi:hypothetical protein
MCAALGLLMGCGGDDPHQFAGTIDVSRKPRTRIDVKSVAKEAKEATKAKQKFDVTSKIRPPMRAEPESK